MFKKLLIGLYLSLCMTLAHAASLTGVWKSEDGGSYYIRQVGNEVWWFGENTPISPLYSNVAHGKVDAKKLILTWADVPKGTIMQSGILVLKVVSDNRLEITTKTGGFAGSILTR